MKLNRVIKIDRVLRTAGGDPVKIARGLGLADDAFNGQRIFRVDVDNPLLHNARLPSGLEAGANEYFRWGGYTSGGLPEAVLDQVPVGAFRTTEILVK